MPADVVDRMSDVEVLLDSWPILELLKGREPAASGFQQLIESAIADELSFNMSRMNYGEVIYSIRKDFPANRIDSATAAFLQIHIQFHHMDDALAGEVAGLKEVNTFSYSDAFGAALAFRLDIPFVTGDREFPL